MQNIDVNKLMELNGAILPLCYLLVEKDEDREFLGDLYLNNRYLMYKVVSGFFGGNHAEMDDMVGTAIQRLCTKTDTLKGLDCNKLRGYIVTTCRNVCISRCRELRRQSEMVCFVEAERLEQIPGSDDIPRQVLFLDLTAKEALAAFPELSEREKELILMRHAEQLEFYEIASELGIKEISARVAVWRAKSKLLTLAQEKKRNGANEEAGRSPDTCGQKFG
jgi:RNA polymerase sigma factor (sigma-70 family)